MTRRVLTDDIWLKIQETMQFYGCYRSKNSKNIMEAILWKLRTGATWRDIPEDLCPWQTAYNRFNRWAIKELWDKFFLNYEAYWIQNGYSLMEATSALISMQVELGTVKIEQLAPQEVEQLQKYTWPSMRTDIRLILTSLGGEVHDSQIAPKLIELVGKADYLVADKGYDSEKIRECARILDMIPVIPRKSNSSKGNPEFDGYLYRLRHLVENAFARLKHFRAIATRYDKLARNYKAMLRLACIFIWCKGK